jgi:hypothetical protein
MNCQLKIPCSLSLNGSHQQLSRNFTTCYQTCIALDNPRSTVLPAADPLA